MVTWHFMLLLNYMIYTVCLIIMFHFLRQGIKAISYEEHRDLFFKALRLLTVLSLSLSLLQVGGWILVIVTQTADPTALLIGSVSLVLVTAYMVFVTRYLRALLIRKFQPNIPSKQWAYHHRRLRDDLYLNAFSFVIMFSLVSYAAVDFFLNVQSFF